MTRHSFILGLALAGYSLLATAQEPTPIADTAPIDWGQPEEESTMPLSLEDAIGKALESNLTIRLSSINPQISRSSLAQSKAAFIPVLSGNASTRDSTSPGGINPATNEPFPSNTTESDQGSFTVNGQLSTGASYSFGVSAFGREGTFINPDAKFQGNFNAQIRQPVLRNAWIDATRRAILVQKNSVQRSDSVFEQQVMNTVAQVESAYYNLAAAIENVKVQEKALELAESTRDENRLRVQYGAMAPLDEKEAESQVAQSRSSLLSAQQTVANQQNALKTLITADFQSIYAIDLEPTDTFEVEEIELDVLRSWAAGLTRRPEMSQMRLDLERQDVEIRFAKNQMFPSVDLTASFGVNGLQASYTRLFDDFVRGDARDKSIGVVISVPLWNRAEKERLRSSKLAKEQLLVDFKRLEQQIQIEIDNAIRTAATSLERVTATREARQYAEEALAAEQKKLEEGISTSFVVLTLQRNLTQTRADEIQALVDYRQALTQLAVAEGTILDRHNIILTGEAEPVLARD